MAHFFGAQSEARGGVAGSLLPGSHQSPMATAQFGTTGCLFSERRWPLLGRSPVRLQLAAHANMSPSPVSFKRSLPAVVVSLRDVDATQPGVPALPVG